MRSNNLPFLFLFLLLVAGCGGGGGSSAPPPVPQPPTPAGANELAVTVTHSLSTPAAPNTPFVSVKVCFPNTTTCKTVPNILLDTGSYGLRVFRSALNGVLPSPPSGSTVLAECLAFVDGSGEWGPVQTADVYLGGEPKATVPIHVIDTAFSAIPATCSSQAPAGFDQSPAQAGFNGVLGVGVFAEDCGAGCASSTTNGHYFNCTGSTCTGVAVALANQVQNPVSALPSADNNGVVVQLPSVPSGGAPYVFGLLVLGIDTQANNASTGKTAYPTSVTGNFSTFFNGASYSSFLDTGSNGLFFVDSALPVCMTFWFCPPATTPLTATNTGALGAPSGQVSFNIGNASSLFATGNSVFAELGGPTMPAAGFDWGLPFFLGRNVFVGIEGKTSNLGAGPYWAY
jgi:hypothetical protein